MVTNTGTETVALGTPALSGAGFTVASVPAALAASESVTLTVTFVTSRAGLHQATLMLG